MRLGLVLHIILFLSIAVPVWAGEIDDLKNQIDARAKEIQELKQKEGEYKAAVSDAHTAASSLEELITDYNQQIRITEDSMHIKEKEISAVTLQIKRAELEIQAKEENIKRIHAYIAAVLQEIYANGEEEITAMMFKYDDFAEFFNQVEYRNSLQGELKTQLDTVKELKEKLEMEKEGLNSERDELKMLKTELETNNAILANQRAEKKNLLAETKNEESHYKSLLKTVKEKQEAIQREIFELEDKLRQAIDAASVPAARPGVLNWPAEGKLSQGYGCTQFAKTAKAYPTCFHNGIDIAGPTGTSVRSARKGKVIAVQNAPYAYGKWIAVEHDNGLVTLYGHLSLQSVSVGQEVEWGTVIGYMGSTGYSTGSHLHFTVYAPNTFTTQESTISGILPIGATINPFDYLP